MFKRASILLALVFCWVFAAGRAPGAEAHGELPAAPVAGALPGPEQPVAAGLMDPTMARLRLKNFVRLSFAQNGRLDGEAADGQSDLRLAEALAGVDKLSDSEAMALAISLHPAIVASRELGGLVANLADSPAPAGTTAIAADEAGIARLRQDLDGLLGRMEAVAPLVAEQYPNYLTLIGRLRGQVQTMDAEGLAPLYDAFQMAPSTRSILSVDPMAIIGPRAQALAQEQRAQGAAGTDALDAGSIHTLSSCNDMAFGPVATVVLENIAEAADEVADLLDDDVMFTNVNIPDPAKIIAAGIATGLFAIAYAARADMDYFSNCNDNAHQLLTEMHAEESTIRLGAMKMLLNDPSKINDLKRTIANRADRMDTFAVEFRRLTLRLDIEKDLLRMGDPRISLFQIPNSICITTGEHQSCGQLDTVRDIVDDTIFDNRALGFNTTLATVALQDGDNQRSLGRYKAAYTRYRYAYQLAVRSE